MWAAGRLLLQQLYVVVVGYKVGKSGDREEEHKWVMNRCDVEGQDEDGQPLP